MITSLPDRTQINVVLPVLARTDRVVTTKVDVVMDPRTVGKEIARMDVSICDNISPCPGAPC
jgi:hypothetical protein